MDSNGLGNGDFAYVIVIFAAALHLVLIISIIICSCCKKRCSCLDITSEAAHGNNNNRLSRPSGHLPDYHERDVDPFPANQSLVDARETRTVTSWHTSFLTRVQARLGFSRANDAPSNTPTDEPPAYSAHNFGEVHTNPVCSEEDDLPPYQDHFRHLAPYYVESEDKPPLYEEVVRQKTS